MNEKKEYKRIKNSIAQKATLKIFLYTMLIFGVTLLFIDGIFNDILADGVSKLSNLLYVAFREFKPVILGIYFVVIMLCVSFLVIRKTMNNLVVILSAVNEISADPDKEVKLPGGLYVIENKLNSIRLDLIKNREAAKESERRKNDLIMYMAHDIKTPLTSVIGYLNLLEDEKEISDDTKEKYIKIALDKSLRVEELTNQFFEITRYNLQDIPINKKTLDLSLLIGQLVDEMYPMLKEKNLNFEISVPEHLMYAGDGDKLARAFGNLIKNAISYSYSNTSIDITAMQMGNKIEIVFKNEGDKIPEYKLEKIFEKFYRADESRQSSTGGSGLGLAITKEIVEAHGGQITVKNEGKFIEFHIDFYV